MKWVLNQVRVKVPVSSAAVACTMVRPPGRRTAPFLAHTSALMTTSVPEGASAMGLGWL